jgi:transcription elongation factor GreA
MEQQQMRLVGLRGTGYYCPMIEEIRRKLQAEVEALNHELHVILPETLKKALEYGDLRENADYQAAIERQGMIQARLEQLRSRLHSLSELDLSKVPKNRIGLGSRVTVTDLETKKKEVYELVIPDLMDLEAGHISVASPLGRALLNKKKKDKVTVQLPFGTRKLRIDEVVTMHEAAGE